MQLVSVPTHKDHNTLDLAIVPSDSILVTDLTVLPVAPSDHFPILSYLKLMTMPHQPVLRSIRHVNTIDIDAFVHDLIDEALTSHPPADLDELVLAYNNTLTRLLDKHAPLIHKRIFSRLPSPWFTPLLSCLKATCRRFERAWRSSKTTFNSNRYAKLRIYTTIA